MLDWIKKSLAGLWMLLGVAPLILAQDTLHLSESSTLPGISVLAHAELLRDPSRRLTFPAVVHHPGFQAIRSRSIKEGPGATCWLRFTVRNQDSLRTQWLLHFSSIDIFRIAVYTLSPTGETLPVDILGNAYPFGNRSLQVRTFMCPLSFKPKEVKTFYVYLDHHAQWLATDIHLLNMRQGYEYVQQDAFIGGIITGASLVYLLVSLVLVFIYRRLINIFFSIYITGAVLFLLGSMGYGFWFLWPDSPVFQDASPYIGLALLLTGFSGLFRLFFRLKVSHRKINLLFRAFTGLFALMAIGFLAWPYLVLLQEKLYYRLFQVEAIACTACFLISFGLGIQIYRETRDRAYLWFLSVFIFLISTSLIILLMELSPLLYEQDHVKSILLVVTVFYETTILSLLLIGRTYQEKIFYQNQIIAERERIVEDLHDEVISIIAGVRISFGLLSRKVADIHLQETFQALDLKISTVVAKIRELSRDLKSDNNYLAPLAAELYRFANDQFELSAIQLHFEFRKDPHQVALPLVVRRNLKGFCKEAIHNCSKYAQAHNCWFEIEQSGNMIYCLIKDDGQGFDPQQGYLHPTGDGNGLRNFRKRAQKMQAAYSLVSQAGQGVEIKLAIDLLQFNKLESAQEDIP